jgi:hypothetical protein
MKIINTRLHGLLDYGSAFILLLPWITSFYTGAADTRILAAVGGITILFSVITDYEFGLVKLLPMKVHLLFDTLSALFLIAMPWLFPLNNYIFYWPVIFGAAALLVALLSSPVPYRVTSTDLDITKP